MSFLIAIKQTEIALWHLSARYAEKYTPCTNLQMHVPHYSKER